MKYLSNVIAISKWLLSKESMTPKKLQKMLYYEYAWFLVRFNKNANPIHIKLFKGDFEDWIDGPVNPSSYYNYHKDGYHENELIQGRHYNLNLNGKEFVKTLNAVYHIYGGFSGGTLEQFTHKEAPWKLTRGNLNPDAKDHKVISDSKIYGFYKDLNSNYSFKNLSNHYLSPVEKSIQEIADGDYGTADNPADLERHLNS